MIPYNDNGVYPTLSKNIIYEEYLTWSKHNDNHKPYTPMLFWGVMKEMFGDLYSEERPRENGHVRQLYMPTLEACKIAFCAYVCDSNFFDE